MTEAVTHKLKPCPFCGGAPKVGQTCSGTVTWVSCTDCEAERDTIEDWNKRADALLITPTYIPGFIESDADRYYNAVISKLQGRIARLEADLSESSPNGADRSWRDMADAPTDGTIIEVVGRYPEATAGFPRYVGFRGGKWLEYSRHEPAQIIPLVWRPRAAFPQFPA